MKKLSKRILSAFLAIIMLASVLPTGMIIAQAAGSVESAVQWAINIANDNSHGYQWGGKGPKDYDCQGLVCMAYKQAGFKVYPCGTPKMKKVFEKAGFTCYSWGSVTLKRGDIMLTPNKHTEIYIGNNKCVAAHKNYDHKSGDSSGTEIQVRKRGKQCTTCSKMTYVLRWNGDEPSYKITTKTSTNETNYSAKLNCTVSPSMNVQAIGLFYSTDENDINKITADTKKDDGGNHIWYLLYENSNSKKMSDYSFDTAKTITQNKYKIKFLPGKKYYYNFVFKANGKWYISDKGSFKTKNNPPKEVTNLRLEKTNASLNDSVWVAWNSVSGADNYRVSVENSKGDIEVYKTTTNCSFTIPKREKADTYTVYVRAENESGVSHYTPVSYVVHSNVTVSFSDGYKLNDLTEQTQSKSVLYNGSVITPVAPERVGYTFKGWSDNGKIYAESTKIDNITSSKSIVGTWSANKYSIKIVDGITNEVIKEFKADFDTKIDMNDYANLAPQHNGYTFSGWSEDSYTVNSPESHTIYARYKWNSKFKINTIIDSVTRAKSKASLTSTDGYSVNIKVSSPSISNSGIDSTVKGRVIVVLKTKAGRMLIETESSAFVLYPDQDNEVSKVINVFVPFESSDKDDLAYSVEAYVVNKYSSAGTISDSAIDTSKIALANSNDWQFTTTKPVVGTNNVIAVNSDLNYSVYNYTLNATTLKESFDSNINGYTPLSSKWVQSDDGYLKYVNSWPTLGTGYGAKFNNTTTVGKYIYNEYGKTPKIPGENGNTRIRVSNERLGTIYYHWCSNSNRGKYYGVTRSNWTSPNTGYKYNNFHCFYFNKNDAVLSRKYVSSIDDSVFERDLRKQDPQPYRDQCLNSMYWVEDIPVYDQYWYKDLKVYSHQKKDTQTGSTRNIAEVPKSSHTTSSVIRNNIKLNTTVDTTVSTNEIKYYAYKTAVKVSHDDKNIYDIKVNVGTQYANEKVLLYVYKSNQLSDYSIEYIANTTIKSNGEICINDAQMREKCSQETGDFTIAISLPSETNSIVIGKIEAPKKKYTVEFLAPTSETNEDGSIKYQTISTQTVTDGENAVIPDEKEIPNREGYHFVCWNNTATNINCNTTIEAVYEQNSYAISFVDWENHQVTQQICKYGETFDLPALPETKEGIKAEWVVGDGSDDSSTSAVEFLNSGNTVKSNMLISVKYTVEKCNLIIVDKKIGEKLDKSTISVDDAVKDENSKTEQLEFGDLLQLTKYEEGLNNVLFSGWKNAITGEMLDDTEIQDDLIIYPVYDFADTTEIPQANIPSGEYTSNQTVELSCATENATIYYTTDGTDPKTSKTATEYTAPISLNKSCVLKFYSMALGMNDSEVIVENYAINTATSGTKYHIVNISANIEEYDGSVYQILLKENKTIDFSQYKDIYGYTFDGLYYDSKHTDRFFEDELITESLTLYANYIPKKYTATFVNSDNKTVLGKSTVDYLSSAAEPQVTVPDGYVFVGWDSYDFECMTEDKTFVAKYCLKSEYATVKFSRSKRTIMEGSTISIKPIVTAIDGSALSSDSYELEWDSDNWSVASVDSSGNITALKAGAANITVTVSSTGESAKLAITVQADSSSKLVLSSNACIGIDSKGYLRITPAFDNKVSNITAQFTNDELSFVDSQNKALTDADLIGTGSKIQLKSNEKIIDSITAVMTGDMTGDGIINNRDVVMLNKYQVGKASAEEYQIIAMDVNSDGYVNNKDAAVIARYLVGKETIK